MTLKTAFESLTSEQRKRIMEAFNEMEPFTVLLEDNHFLSVHTQPEGTFEVIEKSPYWLLGRQL
jgi:hypothetical protein